MRDPSMPGLSSFRELVLFRLRTFYREPDVLFVARGRNAAALVGLLPILDRWPCLARKIRARSQE